METGKQVRWAPTPTTGMHNIAHTLHALAHASCGRRTRMFPVATAWPAAQRILKRRKKKGSKRIFGSPDPAASAARGPGPFPRAGQDPVTGPQPFRGRPSHRTAPGSEARSLATVLYVLYNTVTIKSRAFAYFVQGLVIGLETRPPHTKPARLPAIGDSVRGGGRGRCRSITA